MSLDDKMTELADAIRKSKGIHDKLGISDMISIYRRKSSQATTKYFLQNNGLYIYEGKDVDLELSSQIPAQSDLKMTISFSGGGTSAGKPTYQFFLTFYNRKSGKDSGLTEEIDLTTTNFANFQGPDYNFEIRNNDLAYYMIHVTCKAPGGGRGILSSLKISGEPASQPIEKLTTIKEAYTSLGDSFRKHFGVDHPLTIDQMITLAKNE